ncbi:DUF4834 domain-containing protein [Psychroflexus montanilacus]|uniref:DUF4834 domain-containing protein n=1 Tax=Psychroflexus montanilacus TaxID=2873598 RepID=UPI001CCBE128|nr:DUF4834 domain-containing protein [Psychroflexus montanilacus]MBZ9652945.1 DUF4834 domain-containing protein [Psychroflexus montanilacus]
MVVLKTILIILLVYFGIKLLAKYFGPLFLKYIFKKVQRNMENQFNPHQKETRNNSQKSSKTFKSKSKDSKVGEYVDYEEID